MKDRTISYVWEDEAHTILRIDYREGWTLTEYEVAMLEVRDLIEETSHGVYVINHFGSHVNLPPGFYHKLPRLEAIVSDNLVLTCVIARSNMLEMMLRLFRRITPGLVPIVTVVPTLEAAYEIIEHHRRENSAGDGSSH